MKKQLFILFVAATSLFTACKDDNGANPGDNNNPGNTDRVLSKVTRTEGGESDVSTLTYDNKGRLTIIKNQDNSESANFTYDANNNITKLEFKEGNSTNTFEVTYNNNLPVSGKLTGESSEGPIVLNLTYTIANGKVTEILQKYGEIDYAKSTITYEGNNVKKIDTESLLTGEEQIDEVPDLSSSITYVYGDKKNMFPNGGFKYLLDPMGLSIQFFAKNELKSEKREGFGGDHTTTYTYTYDTKGYPLTSQDSDGITYKYEYK